MSSDPDDAPAPTPTEAPIHGMLVSRHLMEPEPNALAPSLGQLLWLCVFLLGFLVALLQFAT
jgi:hypothetical protein